VLKVADIRRIRLGSFVRPAEESMSDLPRAEDVLGYLIRHQDGLILLDTGMGYAGAETEAWYQPVRVPLPEALNVAGVTTDDIDVVINCHLHFDHCGGNPVFAGRPVVCQRRELGAAGAEDYTVPELVDYAGVNYEQLDGEAELMPGVLVVPTPGHVDGHQSLVLRCDDGTVILAGQSHDNAADFASDALAAPNGPQAAASLATPAWLERLLALDPKRVYFAHDASVWEPV